MQAEDPNGWTIVPREVFEYSMIPWVGGDAAAWLRASARPDPTDPADLVRVPERISRVYRSTHVYFTAATRQQLDDMGYPRLPEDEALDATERQLESASRTSDMGMVEKLAPEAERWRIRADTAHQAEETWERDRARLEEDVPRELVTRRPVEPPDATLGIPPRRAGEADA